MCKSAAIWASAAVLAVACWAFGADAAPLPGSSVTLEGSLICNGACLPDPKPEEHLLVLYAIDGTPEIRAEVETIMAHYPDRGLNAEAAEKVMGEFTARLKYYISPESPALLNGKPKPENHYCQPAAPSSVVGEVIVKDGKKWLIAKSINPIVLHYPKRMLVSDTPFVMPNREPLVLRVTDKLTLKCVAIPPGKFLMGTPFYMWPYYVEEYPHLVI